MEKEMACSEPRDDLLDVLYGEADAEVAARFDAHARSCELCRDELAAFRGVRRSLPAWELPKELAAARRPAPPAWVWGIATAAALILALGFSLKISGAHLRFESGPIAFSVGEPDPGVAGQLEAQATRHQRELETLRAEFAALSVATPAASPDVEQLLLHRVTPLIRASEARQLQLLGDTWDDYLAETEARRRYDLARVNAGLSYVDRVNAERTAELVNYMLGTSAEQR